MGKAVAKKPPVVPATTAKAPWGEFLMDAIIHKRWPMAVLAALSGLLLSLIFAPGNVWPLAYVALVPWLVGVICSQRRAWMFFISYLLGTAFFFFSLNWMWMVTTWPPDGIFGIKVPIGTLLLAGYLGLYLPLAAWLIRFSYRRMRAPLAITVPIVWIATEFIRAYLPAVPYDGRWQYTGLQWFFLAHSHYNVLPVIQMADLTGAYGVSFLIAMVNGWLAELIVHKRVWEIPHRWTPRARVLTVMTLGLLFANLGYGVWQLSRNNLQPGPKIAAIQTDEPLFVEYGGWRIPPSLLQQKIWALLDKALAHKPDIVVLPETMWPYRLNREFREMQLEDTPATRDDRYQQARARAGHERLRQLAHDSGTTIVVGTLSYEYHPEEPYLKTKRFNSVLVYRPGEDEPQRYDKSHLVLFGEFIPFRLCGNTLHRLYNSLNKVMPWPEEYSLTAGNDYKVFEVQAASQNGRTYRFGTPICYEITMADACRRFGIGEDTKRADLLINLSNDGWFHYTSELPQHLAVAVFRAVENRMGLARSVNTGISALVDPKGHILEAMLEDGQYYKPAKPVRSHVARPPLLPYEGFSGVLVNQVPTDPTITLYMRWGNWLPIGCMLICALLLLAWWVDRTYIAVRHLRRTHASEATE